MKEIEEAANYCLNCKLKPCSTNGCPMETNIPEFITEIKNKNYEKAYNVLIENNIFSHVCSLICPQEEQCEGKCVRAIKSEPTKIGKLEEFINKWAKENSYTPKLQSKKKNGKKVAIIGAGPAGLECAIELLKNGYDVDIFEKDSIPGGILQYGIPDFRLPKEIVKEIIENLKQLGANFKMNKELGKDFSIQDLQSDYNAVFVGIGATKQASYPISEKKVTGIYLSDEFLKAYNEHNFFKNLGTVAVIGGGNVAMDCARVAKKMGAKNVKILYRRDRAHMPARELELEEALKDGVEFKELTRVSSANIKQGNIESLNCVRTQILDGKAVDVPNNANFIEDANTVVFAIGQKTDKALLEEQNISLSEWGSILIDQDGKTNLENVYAGGDNTEDKATVCKALAAGKRAAKGIIKNI